MSKEAPRTERKIRRTLRNVALLGVAGGVALTGCGEDRSSAERQAQADARATFQRTTGDDLVSCSISDVRVGPSIKYQGRTSPTVLLDLTQTRTQTSREGWYADKGQTTGKYSAEIAWINPSPTVTHKINGQMENGEPQTIPGTVAISTPNLERLEFGGIDPKLSFNGTETVLIPLNDSPSLQGTREVTVASESNLAFLMESYDGIAEPKDPSLQVENLQAICGSFTVNVAENQATIVE